MQPEFWQRLFAADVHPAKSRALVTALGSFADAPDRLLRHPLLSVKERERARAADMDALRRALDAGAILLGPEDLPNGTLDGPGSAPAVFAWGDAEALRGPTVGIVGTRAASTYGRAVAHKFAEAFSRAGITVVSGGALGIDAAAHKGALEGPSPTAAVLPCGVDKVYPAVHRSLFARIRERGCLVSQFAAGALPTPYRFLIRNHLVACLSKALLVVEAPERSGALSTAHAANELGREVFVAPANIDNLNFRGSHALIRDGATLVDHPDQILDALGIAPAIAPEPEEPLTAAQEKILEILGPEPRSAEHIVEASGLDAAQAMAELTMLELAGRILRQQGGYARRP